MRRHRHAVVHGRADLIGDVLDERPAARDVQQLDAAADREYRHVRGEREAHEEAGLQLAGLSVARGSELPVQRMVAEGLMIEAVQVFDVQLPDDYVPRNLDGEVACFDRWPIESALDGIERGDFTLEASLATLDGLQRAILRREMR